MELVTERVFQTPMKRFTRFQILRQVCTLPHPYFSETCPKFALICNSYVDQKTPRVVTRRKEVTSVLSVIVGGRPN